MPKLSNLDKALKGVRKVADHSADITSIVGLASMAAKTTLSMVDEQRNKIDISGLLHDKTGHHKNLSEAKECLKNKNIDILEFPIKLSEADPKFKDCFEFQVVDMYPKNRIDPGETLHLYYVTSDVIERSKQLFDEQEKQKEKIRSEKQEKRLERKERINKKVSNVVDTTQREIKKVSDAFSRKKEEDIEQEQ